MTDNEHYRRVGRTKHPRWRQMYTWRPPLKFRASYRKRRSALPPASAGYGRDFEAPEWFDLDDFPDLEGEWTEVETWCAGGLGLFERRGDPLPRVPYDGHRVGLEFENERDDMTATALPTLVALLDGVTWHTEFPYGWGSHSSSRANGKGLTDVVVCSFDWPAYRKRRRMVGGSSLNDRWGYLKGYRYIRERGPLTPHEFKTGNLYKTDRYLREIWDFLREKGYLAFGGAGWNTYATVMPLPDHVTAHAVELKQSTWAEALEQAERAAYADYQWVALDAGHLRAASENLDAFRDAGVGLIGIAEGGAVQLVDAAERDIDVHAPDREDLRERSADQVSPADVEVAEKAAETEDATEEEADPVTQAGLDAYG